MSNCTHNAELQLTDTDTPLDGYEEKARCPDEPTGVCALRVERVRLEQRAGERSDF